MKLTKDRLKHIVKEELEQEGILDFFKGKDQGVKDVTFNKALNSVEDVFQKYGLMHNIINSYSVGTGAEGNIGDEYGFMQRDAASKLATLGIQKLVSLFSELYEPLANLQMTAKNLSQKSPVANTILQRIQDQDYGIVSRLMPICVFMRSNGEQILQKYKSLVALDVAIDKGQIEIPQGAGFLGIITGEAKSKGIKNENKNMKLTRDKLKQIIKEELEDVLKEQSQSPKTDK